MHQTNKVPKLFTYFLGPKKSGYYVMMLILRSLTCCEKPTHTCPVGLLSQPPAHFPGASTVPLGTWSLQLHCHVQAGPGASSHIKTEQKRSKSVLISIKSTAQDEGLHLANHPRFSIVCLILRPGVTIWKTQRVLKSMVMLIKAGILFPLISKEKH